MAMLFKFQLPVRLYKIDLLLRCTTVSSSLIPIILNSLHQLLALSVLACVLHPVSTWAEFLYLSSSWYLGHAQHVFLCFSRVQHPQISDYLFSFHQTLMFFRGTLCRLGCHVTPFSFSRVSLFSVERRCRGEPKCDFSIWKDLHFYLWSTGRNKKWHPPPAWYLQSLCCCPHFGWYCAAVLLCYINHSARSFKMAKEIQIGLLEKK